MEKAFVTVVASCPRRYDSWTRLSCWMTKKLAVLLSACHCSAFRQRGLPPQRSAKVGGWTRRGWFTNVRKGRSSIWAFSTSEPRFTDASPQVVVVGEERQCDCGDKGKTEGAKNVVHGRRFSRKVDRKAESITLTPLKQLGHVPGHFALHLLHVTVAPVSLASDVTPRSRCHMAQ